jgi:hypothetical protein
VRSRVGTDAAGTSRAGKPGAGKKSDPGPAIIAAAAVRAGAKADCALPSGVAAPAAASELCAFFWRLASGRGCGLRRSRRQGSEDRHDCVGGSFLTISAANWRRNSDWPSAHRQSKVKFVPSVWPSEPRLHNRRILIAEQGRVSNAKGLHRLLRARRAATRPGRRSDRKTRAVSFRHLVGAGERGVQFGGRERIGGVEQDRQVTKAGDNSRRMSSRLPVESVD